VLDGNPMLRDGKTGDWIGTFLGHKGAVWSARLNRKSDRAVTGSADFSARIWDTYSGEELFKFDHQHIVRACDFSQDGSHVLTGGQEKKLRLFDLNKPESTPLEAIGHEGAIKSVAWDEVHQTILSAGDDKTIRVWDARTMQQVQQLDQDSGVTSMVLSADGNYLTSTAGTGAYFWDTRA
jgi:serine-threonine kinase receptor-associated protein